MACRRGWASATGNEQKAIYGSPFFVPGTPRCPRVLRRQAGSCTDRVRLQEMGRLSDLPVCHVRQSFLSGKVAPLSCGDLAASFKCWRRARKVQ